MDIPGEWIVGVGTFIGTCVTAGIAFASNRMERADQTATKLMNTKDTQIDVLSKQITQIVSDKDTQIDTLNTQIENLSKSLTKKSEDHAATVERLMGVTVGKVEEWSDKQLTLQDKALSIITDLTNEVRKLNKGVNNEGRGK